MKKQVFKIFGFLHRLRFINRWGLMFCTRQENVKEHSFDVATIAHCLAVIHNTYFNGNLDPARAALYAIYHDACEALTGDMPTPIKYYSEMVKAAADEMEALAVRKIVSSVPAEMKSEYEQVLNIPVEYKPLIKAADRLAAIVKCMDEQKCGNDEFVPAGKRQSLELATSKQYRAEVNYFLDHFFPGYEMSLDALCEGNGSWLINREEVQP